MLTTVLMSTSQVHVMEEEMAQQAEQLRQREVGWEAKLVAEELCGQQVLQAKAQGEAQHEQEKAHLLEDEDVVQIVKK